MSQQQLVSDLTDKCKMELKEKFQKIDHIYECCKNADLEITLQSLATLDSLGTLVSESFQDSNNNNNNENIFAASYFVNNKHLTLRLVQIIAEAEDIRLCSSALLLLQILVMHTSRKIGTTLKKSLCDPLHFSLLFESMYAINVKYKNFSEKIPELLTILSSILLSMYEIKECRELFLSSSNNSTHFLGELLSTSCYNNPKFYKNLLFMINILCHKSINCEILASSKFFTALTAASKMTKKNLTVVTILKYMSKNEVALGCLSGNVNVLKFLLQLINQSGNKLLNKRYAIMVLYRITKTADGLNLFKEHKHYNCLLSWIAEYNNLNQYHNKMTVIKAYTILNRTIEKISIHPKPILDWSSRFNVADADSSTEESDSENDSVYEEYAEKNNSYFDSCQVVIPKTPEIVPEIKHYFQEMLDFQCLSTLLLFNNIKNTSESEMAWKDTIEKGIIRNEINNKHSFPDSLILDEESDADCLNSTENEFNIQILMEKFKVAKDIKRINFTPLAVYDLYKDCSFNWNNNTLVFDSHFECGNLNTVIQISELEYNLILTPDTGSSKGLQWFYFQVSNIKSDIDYVFNIINFLKINSQYNYGMQPLMFSVTNYMLHGIGWRRVGKNITYFGNNYTNHNKTRQYRTLSYTVSFKYSNDCVYFAYHYPYTYTRLMTILYPISTGNSKNVYKRIDSLCNTIHNNELPLLTITAGENESIFLKKLPCERPIIVITARAHPGETNSSWIMEGMIKFLLNEVSEKACKIRERYIFKIIPMLNIEGVIYGNTRGGIFGNDLNRCWAEPHLSTCPEIYYTKRLIKYIRRELRNDVAAYIDIHGHSRKKCFFFYGCNPKISWSSNDWNKNDCLESLMELPILISQLNPHIKLNLCKFKIEKSRESTARVVMWREFDIEKSYTLECSYCAGDKNKTLNTKILTEIGANVIEALGMLEET